MYHKLALSGERFQHTLNSWCLQQQQIRQAASQACRNGSCMLSDVRTAQAGYILESLRLTMHRLTQAGEETVGMGISGVVDDNVCVAVLCEVKVRWFAQSPELPSEHYGPRTCPRATFSELILQASSCTVRCRLGEQSGRYYLATIAGV